MEIPLLVLVLQIGFNAALNSRDYNSNAVIASPRFLSSGQTRKFAETDSDEQSDSGYSTSLEDYGYRSVLPLQSRSIQRRNDYLSYNNRLKNDESFEVTPIGGVNSNSVENLQPLSSLPRRPDLNFRRPYLRNRPSNLRPIQTRQYYRKANDDLSLEVSSLDGSDPKDATRLEEEVAYLQSLLSLIKQTNNNRRGQNRKYNRQGNNLSIDASPIDKFNLDEDSANTRNPLKMRKNHNPNDYVDKILLVTDSNRPSKLPTSLCYNKLYNRRYYDELNLDEEISNNMLHICGLKPKGKKNTNYIPVTRKINSNKYSDVADGDNTEKVTVLRLGSLEDVNLESPSLSTSNRGKQNHRNFLRLSLSPQTILTLNEEVASNLSDILSETLDVLNLGPVNIKRTDVTNNEYRRKENNRHSAEEDSFNNPSHLQLGSLSIPKSVSRLLSYRRLLNRFSNRNIRTHKNHKNQVLKKLSSLPRYIDPNNLSSKRNKKTHGNHTRKVFKKLFDKYGTKYLLPYHESKNSNNSNKRKRENQSMTENYDNLSDEFSLDTLFEFQKEGNVSSNLTNLSSTSHKKDFDDDSNDTTDALNVKFPWNDPSSPEHKIDSKLSSSPKLKSLFKLKNPERKKNNMDTDEPKYISTSLQLEFPSNDQLNPDAKAKSKLRSYGPKENKNVTSAILQLEFPWNDVLSSDDNKDNSFLRVDNKKDSAKDTTDALNLEYPWNDALSSEDDKSKSLLMRTDNIDNAKDSTEVLHLEFPWNGALSTEDNKIKSRHILNRYRNDDEKDNVRDSTQTLNLEFPWNGALSIDRDGSKTQSRFAETKTNDTTDTLHLEFPWNGQLILDSDKEKSQLRHKDSMNDTKHVLKLEFPWNDALVHRKNETDNIKLQSVLRTQPENRQDKEPDKLKLEFPWNNKPSLDKVSDKMTTLRLPDPFFVHPFLRSRNINKHPNYFRRSYNKFSEGHRLDKNSYRKLHLQQPYDDRTVLDYTTKTEKDPSDSITFPSGRRPIRLRTKENAARPKYIQPLLKVRNKIDRKTYNDTIIFPNY